MKKNKKGFVLAEAIVVAVFVLGMFTYLAMNIFPLITKYDKAINYNDPNEVYAVNTFYDELSAATDVKNMSGIYSFNFICEKNDGSSCNIKNKSDDKCSDGAECKPNTTTVSCKYNDGTGDSACTDVINMDYYKVLALEYLKIERIFIYNTPENGDAMKPHLSRWMREYFNYSKNKFEQSNTTKILAEFSNGKYASLEI